MQLAPGPNEVRIALRPGAEISGSVRSADGSSLPLATIEATTEFSLNTEFHRANTVADGNGTFRIAGLEPGRYNVTARSPGHADGGPAQPVEVADANVDGIEIVLEPGASIVGVVTGLTPSDLAQVDVTAWQDTRRREATPDAAGNFVIEGVGPGTWRVTARKGDVASARNVERSATVEQGTTEVFVELPFERGLRLAGQVLEGGRPVPGARLAASAFGERNGQSTTTDHQGSFVLEGLSPGLNQLVIGAGDFSAMELRSIELQTDLEGVRIELEAALATLTGIVIDDETGRPLDFAQLMAADAATIGALASGADIGSLVANVSSSFAIDGGRFELDLRVNAERLLVTRQGYESTQIPLNASAGQRQEGLVIRLRPAAPEVPNR